MSIKKLGRGGEYLYFSVKKKFYPLVFLAIKIVCDFTCFYVKNLVNSKQFYSYTISSFRLRPLQH
jgi:hypothetical protein